MSRILVADDAMFMRVKIRTLLQAHGHAVVGEAEDGAVACRLYRDTAPDLVTMDITMPNMDGVRAVREIRKTDPKARILMISAMGQQDMVIDAIAAGASGFVVKPFQDSTLLEAITRTLAI